MEDDASSVGGGGVTDAYRKHLNRQLGHAEGEEDFLVSPRPKDGSNPYIAEIERLRDALSTTGQGPLEAKYLEQVKRNRDLLVKLESERAKTTKLTARIVTMEKEKLDAQQLSELARGVNLPSQRSGTTSGASVNATRIGAPAEPAPESLEERLEKANKSSALQRKAIDDLKRENARIRRVLQLEIGGDEEQIETALRSQDIPSPAAPSNGKTQGWRGRAQQITLLKGKLKDMERNLRGRVGSSEAGDGLSVAPDDGDDTATVRTEITTRTGVTAATTRDFDEVARSVVEGKQRKTQMHAREMQLKIEEKSREVEDEKRKNESYQARLQILERDNQHMRNCLQRMIEKTENDDMLIAAYKSELDEKRNEIRRAATAGTSTRGNSNAGAQEAVDRLERENARLLDLVADMRSNSSKPAVQLNAWNAPSNAIELIEEQRRTIMALETQLQRRDKASTAQFDSAKGCDVNLRDENSALKYRIKTLSEMMDKEIALHQAMAAEKVAAMQAASEVMSAATGDRLPPIHGSRPSSNASATRMSSRGEQRATPPPSATSGPSQQDFDDLKQQYTELKRAFNAQQSRSMK